MKTDDIRKMGLAYVQVLEKSNMDPVNPSELKGTHAQRKDKDIDNDGKVDKSDEYLHNRRQAISKAMKKEATDTQMGTITVTSDEERKKRAQMYRDKKAASMKKEEVEQVDEISQDTLRSYHAKAGLDLRKKREKLDKGTLTSKDYKQGQNRVTGLNRSANRMEEVEVDEATLSAKAARAGKDIGKPGKMFAKIAGEAEKRYGSKEAGQRVAGAVLKKMRTNEEVELEEAKSWFMQSDHDDFAKMSPEEKKDRHQRLLKLTKHSDSHIRSFAKAAANEFKSKYMNEEVELDEASDPRKVRDELKSKGKHKEAGEHAYKHGLGRSYGQHFGMRSSKNSAEMEFHKGYDHAKAREDRAARLKNKEDGNRMFMGVAGQPYKEEVEQIDEISSKSRQSYNKAANASLDKAMASGDKKTVKKRDRGLDLSYDQNIRDMKKRRETNSKKGDYDYNFGYGESAEWPIYSRILEKRDVHVKGATPPEPIDSKASKGEKDFVNMHGGLTGNDSGIDGVKAAADTAKAAAANVKVSPKRSNDQTIGDKTMPKAKV